MRGVKNKARATQKVDALLTHHGLVVAARVGV